MANRSRKAALSAAGLMLIAGCAGGGHSGSVPPQAGGPNFGSPSKLVNGAAVTLSITVPPRGTQARGRTTLSSRPAAVRRVPSWVSPSTYFVGLYEFYGAPKPFFTYFTLSQCSPSGSTYICPTELPYGTVTLYTSLYDQQGYLLSTNMFSNPGQVTIYPNGSANANNIDVTTAGVVSNLQQMSPSFCFSAGYQQTIPLYFLDADGNTIVGPLANPITGNFTAYNGAGLGAINIYVMYDGSPVAANNLTLYDTSVYTSPYFFVSGQEGAINIAASAANIPVYSNGSTAVYSINGGIAATGTYIAWGIQNPPIYGIYPIAVQQTLNQAVPCTSEANGTDNTFVYVESFVDPVSGMPYLIAGDTNNNVTIFDAFGTANYTHAYNFFQTSNAYGNPGPKADLLPTYSFAPGQPFNDLLTSAVIPGRVDAVSAAQIDLIDTSNGSPTADNVFSSNGITLTSSTRFSSDPAANALYYTDPGTSALYGINTAGGPPGVAFALIDFSPSGGYPISGQIYATSTSGNGSGLQVVRGADSSNNFDICAFDASAFAGSVTCRADGSMDNNPVSMQYDPGSGQIMFATGGTTAKMFSAHGVTPATFIGEAPMTYTLAHNAGRILSGLEGTPGVAGFYGGPQASGPCSGTGEVTWLRWNGASWVYLASLCWPNHYLTLSYP